MSYYTVDPCDVSAYGDIKLPTLPDGIMEVSALGPELKPYALDFETVRRSVKGATRVMSGVYAADMSQTVNTSQRSSEYCSVNRKLYDLIAERLTFVVNHHVPSPTGWKLSEGVQFLCYDAKNSGHFNMHTDSAYFSSEGFNLTSPERKLSTVTYLNDDYEGGELILGSVRDPTGNLFRKKMEPGSMIIFPSDIRFPHEVIPVRKGQRYSIVAWFDYR
jgi:predicted 2-oxoglutarate/Fe(II)-dependent dioxygenase YbiX